MMHTQLSSTKFPMQSIADLTYVADNPNTFRILLNALGHTKKTALNQIAPNITTIQNLVFRAPITGESDRVREAVFAAFASYRRCLEAVR